VPHNLGLQAGWNVLESLPIGLRKCLCKASLICILYPVKSVPRFSPTLSHTFPHFPTLSHTYPLLRLSKLFFSFPSARAMRRTEKLTRRDMGASTYPPTKHGTKHGTRHFIALPFLLHPAGNIAFLVDPLLNVSNPAGRPPTDACLESELVVYCLIYHQSSDF
jgi:hypothetical protein